MKKKKYEVKISNSTYIFKLESVLSAKRITKYLLEKDTGLDHKTINNYCYGTLKRLDLRVLTILCEYLKCDFEDVIELKTK